MALPLRGSSLIATLYKILTLKCFIYILYILQSI